MELFKSFLVHESSQMALNGWNNGVCGELVLFQGAAKLKMPALNNAHFLGSDGLPLKLPYIITELKL